MSWRPPWCASTALTSVHDCPWQSLPSGEAAEAALIALQAAAVFLRFLGSVRPRNLCGDSRLLSSVFSSLLFSLLRFIGCVLSRSYFPARQAIRSGSLDLMWPNRLHHRRDSQETLGSGIWIFSVSSSSSADRCFFHFG